jgi:hypothetical protein
LSHFVSLLLLLCLHNTQRQLRKMGKTVREASTAESELSTVNTNAQFGDPSAFPAVGDSRTIIRAMINSGAGN